MKLAVSGKGGVGKSTCIALMARIFRDSGYKVLAVDADPDMNLAGILGVPHSDSLTPISQFKELIAERTGTSVNQPAPLFKMNPKVDDIPDQYCTEHEGIKFMAMGTISRGGGGCACPINTFLKQLLAHMVLMRDEAVLLDMEAGIEHLGRGTAMGVDRLAVIVEPSRASIETAHRVRDLATDLGIRHIEVIGNKVRSGAERNFIEEHIQDIKIAGFIDDSEEIRGLNTNGLTALDIDAAPLHQLKEIIENWRNHGE
jgi:CO dehydrogenase maturation factor